MGRILWVCAADVLAFGREDKNVTVEITAEDDIDSIAEKLKDKGLIRYPRLFKLYADLAARYGMDIIASGGVSDMGDVRALHELGLYGAIIGRAYYNGAINLAEAVEAVQ